MYGVGGSQGSIDYSDDKFEPNQAVGEVPFSCLWTARGELVQGDDPRTEEATELSFMRWFKAERLTSGVRDVNRVEMQCNDAGCAITWQEDPEGLRGGSGEGPGEGWSGAVANSGTDIWYSYIDAQNFDVVQDPVDDTGATPMTLADYELAAAADAEITQQPKPFVPMAMPMRLTDNEKCNVTNPKPYCIGTANPVTDMLPATDYGLKDMCAATITVPTGQDDTPTAVCVDDTGLPNIGNTAATRPRIGLYSYDSTDALTAEGTVPIAEATADRDAFAVIVAEEDKGVGKFGFKVDEDLVFTDPLVSCDIDTEELCEPFDEGKNLLYHSFGMSLTDAVGDNVEDTLVENLTHHWNQLNQPEVNWKTGEFYPPISTEALWNFEGYNFEFYNTEIARRGSLLAQDIDAVGKDGLFAFPTWKQGTMNRGGPADVLARRIVAKENWKVKDGNPYAFTNMQCDEWLYGAGDSP